MISKPFRRAGPNTTPSGWVQETMRCCPTDASVGLEVAPLFLRPNLKFYQALMTLRPRRASAWGGVGAKESPYLL